MTSGIQSKGTDLDSIFALYQSGTHPAATGIEVNGTDIATRYQPLPGTAAAATGIKTNGSDLNTLFSTTSTPPSLGFAGLYSSALAGRNNTSLTFPTTSTWSVTTNGAWQGSHPPVSGSLTTYGAVNQFLLHIITSGSVSAQLTTAVQDTWTTITAGLLIVEYDTFQLFGNATNVEFSVSLRNGSGPVTSVTTTEFQIHNTNPG